MQRFIAVTAISIFLGFTPTVFPCGPTMPSGGGGGGNTGTPRQQWVHHRLKHLKHQAGEDARSQRTADAIDLGLGNVPTRSHAYQHQAMINRFEFLALKREMKGALSYKEAAEMAMLQQALLAGY